MRRATSAASPAERTTLARGTGIPISCSRRLVSSLLPATSTEMSGVALVTVAQTRFW
jgi:hypothetical protein